jgi:hypothetical protein
MGRTMSGRSAKHLVICRKLVGWGKSAEGRCPTTIQAISTRSFYGRMVGDRPAGGFSHPAGLGRARLREPFHPHSGRLRRRYQHSISSPRSASGLCGVLCSFLILCDSLCLALENILPQLVQSQEDTERDRPWRLQGFIYQCVQRTRTVTWSYPARSGTRVLDPVLPGPGSARGILRSKYFGRKDGFFPHAEPFAWLTNPRALLLESLTKCRVSRVAAKTAQMQGRPTKPYPGRYGQEA